jgi:Xaa-Pro aminopeptidase
MVNFILNRENEVYYECGYSCDNVIFLSLGSEKFFITDARYTIEAKQRAKAEVITTNNLLKTAKEIILKNRVKSVIIDPTKWDYSSYIELQKVTTLKNELNFSHKKRMIKSPEELEIIKKAVHLGAVAFERFVDDIDFVDEYELSYRFKERLTNRGRNSLSFEPIVAIGENSAKPHSTLTQKKLQKDDILLLDAGVKYERYCSDRTRSISISDTISVSKIQKFKDPFKQKIYDIVLKAQEEAIKNIKVGMKISKLDKIAREVIQKSGYGDYFVHSLGHGVGLDIHEWPYINSKNSDVIEEGMVFTIEPGIYLEGQFGIRIEDMVCINYDSRVEIMSEYI